MMPISSSCGLWLSSKESRALHLVRAGISDIAYNLVSYRLRHSLLLLEAPPNQRLKLSGWGGHIGWSRSILIVAAPARSLSATR
jgi:hypothetical protein